MMNKRPGKFIIPVSVVLTAALFAFFLKDILVPYVKLELAHDLEGAKALLVSRGALGFLTVVLVEALQMVVVFIPAEFIQISSGMSYPFWLAIPLCDLGVCLGASIIYVLVNTFKYSAASEKDRQKIQKLAAGSKKERGTVLLMYFLFIMPVIPFGAICYFASGTKLKYPKYILTVATGVIPSIVTSNLMGTAAKYFIRNALPIPVLVLIIVLLGAALFTVLFIFLDKVYFKEDDGTPDSPVYSGFFRLAGLLRGKKQRLHADNTLMHGLEGPFVLLSNHQSFYDFYYVSKLAEPHRPAYVVNRHYVSLPIVSTLARKAGFIPKKLFTPDAVTARGVIRTVKNGYPVVIFPEGRLCLDGRTNRIAEPGAELYKKLGVPIVTARIRGAYFANPKWRKRFYRSDIFIEATRVISPEEAAGMTAGELERAIEAELEWDESREPVGPVKNKRRAEGVENVLYRCADCGALYTTKTRGDTLYCTACGARHVMDEYCVFDGGTLPISEYYERIKRLERPGLEGLVLETAVDTVIFPKREGKKRGRKRREKGFCRLDASGLYYRSGSAEFRIDSGSLPALAFSCGAEFEAYHDDRLYYFYPAENRRQVVRWALIADMLKEEGNEERAQE